jgi:hypothetical protein
MSNKKDNGLNRASPKNLYELDIGNPSRGALSNVFRIARVFAVKPVDLFKDADRELISLELASDSLDDEKGDPVRFVAITNSSEDVYSAMIPILERRLGRDIVVDRFYPGDRESRMKGSKNGSSTSRGNIILYENPILIEKIYKKDDSMISVEAE